ncbi:MAG: hemerythrin domain-containing protein [Acidobacteriota bacterium]|nr:hemerythrin domain-containing protein [Acidobacteriota bacterium]
MRRRVANQGGTMDAFELLKNDHKKVSELFKQIESASGQAKKQLFSQVKSELDLHAHIEEKFLYPALENTKEAREITLEAYEEHKVVKELLAELAAAGTLNDEWDAKFTVLKENVEHHVEEEEGELFDKAEDALGDEKVERIGAEMEAEKARRKGGDPNAQPRPRDARTRPAKASKKESPGVLKRLANLVGLGDSSAKGARKSTMKGSKSSATKQAAKGKSSKAAAKTAAKKSGAAKASKRTSAGARSTKRSAKKAGGRTSGTKSTGRSGKKRARSR